MLFDMESLFATDFHNKKPFRKYEPLIRFSIDGKPQPRKLLKDSSPQLEQKIPEKNEEVRPDPPQVTSIPKTIVEPPKSNQTSEDLKRKLTDPPASGIEPKKKQQKQQSIMKFFNKKA